MATLDTTNYIKYLFLHYLDRTLLHDLSTLVFSTQNNASNYCQQTQLTL
jgi:hypothetical protein